MAAMYCPVVVPPPPERHAHHAGGLHGATATALSSAAPTSTVIAAGPGLRSSCETCAASKLKCSKERPSCARCVKRGLNCTYVLLKRAGRKPGQAQTSSRPRRRAPSSTGPSPPSGVTGTSTRSEMLQELFGTSLEMTVDGFDEAMSGGSRLHCGDLLDDHSPSAFTADPFSIHGLDGDDSHSMLDVPPLINHASMEPRTPQAVSMSDHDSQLLWTGLLDSVSCSCLARVLSLLKRYSASSERLCMHQHVLELDERLENVSTQSIFGQNETAVELLGGMLDCQCFQDGYLVVMMALVMFKILGWYAAVAQRTKTLLPGEDQIPSLSYGSLTVASSVVEEQISNTPTTIRGFRLDGEDAERRTAQLILGELHRVRQLIERFASRLKLLVEEMQDADRARVAAKGLCANATLPTSTLVYNQLETDLRSEWRALSARVIDRLKKL